MFNDPTPHHHHRKPSRNINECPWIQSKISDYKEAFSRFHRLQARYVKGHNSPWTIQCATSSSTIISYKNIYLVPSLSISSGGYRVVMLVLGAAAGAFSPYRDTPFWPGIKSREWWIPRHQQCDRMFDDNDHNFRFYHQTFRHAFSTLMIQKSKLAFGS